MSALLMGTQATVAASPEMGPAEVLSFLDTVLATAISSAQPRSLA